MDPWLRRESKCIAWIGASLWRTCLDMAKQICRQRRICMVCSFLINCDGTGHGCASWLPCAGSFIQPQDAVAVHQKWNGQWKHVIQDWWDCHFQYKLWEIPRRVWRIFWTWGHRVIEYFHIDLLYSMIYFMPKGRGFQDDFLYMWWHFYSNIVSSVRHEICVDMIMYRPAITADSMQHLVSLKAPFVTLTSRTTSTPPTGWERQFTCTRSPKM